MSAYFEKPLPVGAVGGYSFTFDPEWLAGQAIASANVTVPEGNATVGTVTISGADVFVRLTGVTAGYCRPHCQITTADGRGDCLSGRLLVNEC